MLLLYEMWARPTMPAPVALFSTVDRILSTLLTNGSELNVGYPKFGNNTLFGDCGKVVPWCNDDYVIATIVLWLLRDLIRMDIGRTKGLF